MLSSDVVPRALLCRREVESGTQGQLHVPAADVRVAGGTGMLLHEQPGVPQAWHGNGILLDGFFVDRSVRVFPLKLGSTLPKVCSARVSIHIMGDHSMRITGLSKVKWVSWL